MATFSNTLRRGLPRHSGGEPWPSAGAGPIPEESAIAEPGEAPASASASAPADDIEAAAAAPAAAEPIAQPQVPVAPAVAGMTLRRGLPRVPGGEPWPPESSAPSTVAAPEPAAPTAAAVSAEPAEVLPPTARTEAPADAAPSAAASGAALRRGLPRTPDGEPWPAAGFAPSPALAIEPADSPPALVAEPVPASTLSPPSPLSTPSTALAVATGPRPPIPFPITVFPGTAAREYAAAKRAPAKVTTEPALIGPFTKVQWAGATIVGGLGLLFAAGMVVLAVRWLLSLSAMQDFLTTYPGEYSLPVGAPIGFPAWLGWQHFFNTFLIVLIIRSGWRVRNEKRPTAFWSPRGNKKRKISLTLWFHQALDLLWVANGVIFVVLLFVTGQWLRIVPTSWEVFPNALSAVLQYISLDWPTENGWVNYNSVQQLAYFSTVFIAAPLAIATGVRMSGIWPKNATALNKAYPVEWARAVHFPVMLYFVLFIFVHVVLVFATGALRNLNHMYGGQDAVNWTGFWIFAASMVVVAAGWVAARPLVIAPIAGLFGTVKGR